MRVIALVLSLASLASPGSVARADPERAAVEKLLAGYEAGAPIATLRALGPGVDRALIAIATDERESPLRRARALRALGFVPSLAGRALLVEVLHGPRDPANLPPLRAAILALGDFGADEAALLRPLLHDASPELRAAAATALAASRSATARSSLSQRLPVERDARVLAAIVRALRSLDEESR